MCGPLMGVCMCVCASVYFVCVCVCVNVCCVWVGFLCGFCVYVSMGCGYGWMYWCVYDGDGTGGGAGGGARWRERETGCHPVFYSAAGRTGQ